MTQDPEKTQAPCPTCIDRKVDHRAAKRAAAAADAVRTILPEAAVAGLAEEVISRLAAKVHSTPERTDYASVLADTLVARDHQAALRLVSWLVGNDIAIDTVYQTYVAGAARVLGERWTRNELTAEQVSLAAGRIFAIMRGISACLRPRAVPDGRHAVFATVPGEEHTLGVSMGADMFRHEGWLIDLKLGLGHDELLEELARSEFGILGLSICCHGVLPDLIRLIAAIRVSFPHALIAVAGQLAAREPRLRKLTDADLVSNEFDTLRRVMSDFHQTMRARQMAVPG